MPRVEQRVEVRAPPAKVWALLKDIERWPAWRRTVESVEVLNGLPLRTGLRARVREREGRARTWQVTHVVEGRSFTWQSRSPGTITVESHQIADAPAGSLVTLGVEFSGLGGLLFGWARRRTATQELRILGEDIERELEDA